MASDKGERDVEAGFRLDLNRVLVAMARELHNTRCDNCNTVPLAPCLGPNEIDAGLAVAVVDVALREVLRQLWASLPTVEIEVQR